MSLCFNCLLSGEILNMYMYSISFCGRDSTSYIGTGGEMGISKIGSYVRSVVWHYITTKAVLCDRRSVVRKPLQILCTCFNDFDIDLCCWKDKGMSRRCVGNISLFMCHYL
jgi:hypothetical protein